MTAISWKAGELVIEIGGTSNNDYLFDPLGMVLRGKWSPRNVIGGSSAPGAMAMPDMPGMMVALDVTKRTLRGVDPLSLPAFKKLLQDANVVHKRVYGAEICGHDETVKRNMKPGDIKTALWTMSELVRAGKATVISGTMPAPEKIMAMEGKLRVRAIMFNKERGDAGLNATEEEEADILSTIQYA